MVSDVPFSMVFFSTNGWLKQKMNDEHGNTTIWENFFGGCAAGSLAASLSTPLDVIKTRLQAPAREGATPYKGIVDCFTRTVKEDGVAALGRGMVPRIIVISPLFGIALAVYEFQKVLIKKWGI